MSIAREGLKFILPPLALAFVCGALGWAVPAVLFAVLALAFAFFFRDPRRVPPAGEGRWVSPADGKVLIVEPVEAAPVLGGPATRIAIFLSLLDVHVTRSPIGGTVRSAEYRPGKFLRAYTPEAPEVNESNTLVLDGPRRAVVVKQIVGLAARRIKCFVRPGDAVARGGRMGLMYFGSRVEVFLPPGVPAAVAPGAVVRAGLTVIAEAAE